MKEYIFWIDLVPTDDLDRQNQRGKDVFLQLVWENQRGEDVFLTTGVR